MAQSLSQILLHLIFRTKDKHTLIPKEILPELHAYIAGICRENESNAYRVGGVEDHIHIVCTLPRTITVSNLLQDIKSISSTWIKEKTTKQGFAWQAGYGVFSLGQSQLNAIIKYIETQEDHHKKKTHKEELLYFLNKYNIDYKEEYL